MPPSEASAPGSIGKNRPWSRRCSLSALRVMPGSTTQSRSSACTASTWFMSRTSIETPPCGALTWPSSEVPVPNGITGTRCAAQMRTISCTSSVDCGNTTASGGWFSIQVMVLPCCSRTACEVTSAVAEFARRARATAASIGFGIAPRRRATCCRHCHRSAALAERQAAPAKRRRRAKALEAGSGRLAPRDRASTTRSR